MNSQRTDEYLTSENPSILSEISLKQQNNYSKLKEHSDFLANFIRNNNISINDNPSVESKIMETPLRSDIIGIKSGQVKSSQQTPQTQRTVVDDSKKVSARLREEQENSQQGLNKISPTNFRKKYDQGGYSDSNYIKHQIDNQSYDISEEGDILGNRGSSQLESKNDFESESNIDIHSKGGRVINTIDNLFNKMKAKYNIDFSLKEMQRHLNIPDTTSNSENNNSRQNMEFTSQENSQNPSFINQLQRNEKQQSTIIDDYETNADSIVQKIRNKVQKI